MALPPQERSSLGTGGRFSAIGGPKLFGMQAIRLSIIEMSTKSPLPVCSRRSSAISTPDSAIIEDSMSALGRPGTAGLSSGPRFDRDDAGQRLGRGVMRPVRGGIGRAHG